jgi:hypothetical protein
MLRADMSPESSNPGYAWLMYSLLTVVSWGVYGVFLHSGQMNMADPVNGRYKAFLFVGIAYFLTAVLAPLAVLLAKGASWSYPGAGMAWSLVAGIVGAIGAFGVLLAFGAKGTPAVVMSIVFAGAPVVNAVYTLWLHPPAGGVEEHSGAIFPGHFAGGARWMSGDLFQAESAPEKTGRGGDGHGGGEALNKAFCPAATFPINRTEALLVSHECLALCFQLLNRFGRDNSRP